MPRLTGDVECAERRQGWAPVVDHAVAARARAVAREIAARLRDREQVLAASRMAKEQTQFPQIMYWLPYGIAQGDAGLALMCSYLDACFPAEGWDITGHEYLACAVQGTEDLTYLPLGAFAGLAGLAFAARSLSRNGLRYKTLLDLLDSNLFARILVSAGALTRRHGVAPGEFDVISGLSGMGAYLLRRGSAPPGDVALQGMLQALVALTETTDGVPHWYTPPDLTPDETMAKFYPQGNLNCGLAHGIPGPLAIMALALKAGVMVEGLRAAAARSADWIVRHRTADPFGLNWPTVVPYSPGGSARPEQLDCSRAAWCYGTPGVARALWLAGQALQAQELMQLAIEGMAAVYRRPVPERHIDSPTFCHGVAGLLQVMLRFAHDTGLPLFAEGATTLCEQLLELYEPDRPLGFRSIEPAGNRVDQPGLLDGAPGVVLTLLAASMPVEPSWDRLFLLS